MKDLDENDLKLWKEDEKKLFSKHYHSKLSHTHDHDDQHHVHKHDKLNHPHDHEHEHIIKMWGDERGYTIIGEEDEGMVE